MPSQDLPPDPTKTVLEQMNDDNIGVVWDRGEANSVKGLHLRIFASGKRAFYFLYTTKHGLRRRPKIGEGIGLTEARKIAANMRGQIALGIDPQALVDAGRKEKTIGEVFAALDRNYYDQPRFVESGRRKEVGNIYEAKIKRNFGTRRLSDIRSPEIRLWHDGMRKTPNMANRALEVLSKIYSFAIEQEWIERNPCLIIIAFPERKRKRIPSRDELKKILSKLYSIIKSDPNLDNETLGFRDSAIFTLALFYTGSRPKMMKDVCWEHATEVSEKGIQFVLPGKMTFISGENERVFIPTQILALLPTNQLKGKLFKYSSARRLWNKLVEELNLQDVWVRDARKVFASVGLKKGVSIDQIGEALNHRSAQTTKRYVNDFDNGNAEVTSVVADELDFLLS